MEELSAVGEQVFDAECILNKRLKKVRAVKQFKTFSRGYSSSGCLQNVLPLLVFLPGKVGVSREVEGMVIQVSTSGPVLRPKQ